MLNSKFITFFSAKIMWSYPLFKLCMYTFIIHIWKTIYDGLLILFKNVYLKYSSPQLFWVLQHLTSSNRLVINGNFQTTQPLHYISNLVIIWLKYWKQEESVLIKFHVFLQSQKICLRRFNGFFCNNILSEMKIMWI